MTSRKEERPAAYYDKSYEQNEIRLRGILYFGAGLLVLIVITFALMWALLGVMKDEMADKNEVSPMAVSEKDKLPPEPRLQLAPGFKVDSPDGTLNLELLPPSAEYHEVRREWDRLLEKGQIDPNTGTVIMMPIDVAKEKLLEENIKAKSGPDVEHALINSRTYVSDSSAGRLASERRR